jgi:hypothetical protein
VGKSFGRLINRLPLDAGGAFFFAFLSRGLDHLFAGLLSPKDPKSVVDFITIRSHGGLKSQMQSRLRK